MNYTAAGQKEFKRRDDFWDRKGQYRSIASRAPTMRMPTTQQIATARVPPTPPPQYVAKPAAVPFSPAPAQYAPPPTTYTTMPVRQTYV
jgi:hypothetical protein